MSNELTQVKAGFFDVQGFELMQRVAKCFASSDLVPKQYKNNISNCMIALNISQRMGADLLMVMQNLYVVHGSPSWSAQFLIATANMCGRFSAIRFEFFGEKGTDSWGCKAWAIEKETGERLESAEVSIALAKKEGWYQKSGSKWQSMPQQMLMYRAGAWWVRSYAPELSMGLQTAEEVHDVYDASKSSNGVYEVQEQAQQNTLYADILQELRAAALDGQVALMAKLSEIEDSKDRAEVWKDHADSLINAANEAQNGATV